MHLLQIVRQKPDVAPDHIAAAGIQGDDVILRRADVHITIINDRGCLVPLSEPGGETPDRSKLIYIVFVDLIQAAITVGVVGATVHEPIARLRVL